MPVATPPTTVQAFLQLLMQEHANLSKQLQIIGQYVEAQRDHIGLEKISDIASHCGVQPSAVVRFAQHFGFKGFSPMQALFRQGIATQLAPNRSYQARIRQTLLKGQSKDAAPIKSNLLAQEFTAGAIAGLQQLHDALPEMAMDEAVDLLAKAQSLWVVGARRAFPVATYLAYALQHTQKPVQLMDFTGAMHGGQARGLHPSDVLVAVSFAPYAPETMSVVRQAHKAGVPIIAITDSRLGALAPFAQVNLVVQESAVFGFRALSNTMVMVQSLFVALAYRLELQYQPTATAEPNEP